MNLMVRILMGTALFAFGFYLGREVGRAGMIEEGLRETGTRRWQPGNRESGNAG